MTYTKYRICWFEKNNPEKGGFFEWFYLNNLSVFDLDEMVKDYEEENSLCHFWVEFQ